MTDPEFVDKAKAALGEKVGEISNPATRRFFTGRRRGPPRRSDDQKGSWVRMWRRSGVDWQLRDLYPPHGIPSLRHPAQGEPRK
jgi:hypothetical protein